MNICRVIVLLILSKGLATAGAGQSLWTPPASFRNVPVLADCRRTGGGIGLALPPSLFFPRGVIFFCADRARRIDQQYPGVSRFFLAHEFGHLALRTRDESAADRWAGHELSESSSGKEVLRTALRYFLSVGAHFDPYYGSGLDRAWRLALAGGMARVDWPAELQRHAAEQGIKRATGTRWGLRVTRAGLAADCVLRVDHRPVGFLSVQPEESLITERLDPSRHVIEADDLWLYQFSSPRALRAFEVHLQAQAVCGATGTQATLVVDEEDGNVSLVLER